MSAAAAAAAAPVAPSFANRLEAKLSSLTETSSKESIQTLAKWMGFNRKHAASFAQVLQARLQLLQDSSMTEKLQVTYINVIHEVMLLEQQNASKWDRLSELRCALGEDVVLHLAKHNAWSEMAKEKLLLLQGTATTTSSTTTTSSGGGGGGGGFLKVWDASNVFGGPTLISQIRKELIASPSSSSSSSSPPSRKPAAAEKETTPPSSTAESKPSQLAAEAEEDEGEEAPAEEAAATEESSIKLKEDGPKAASPAAAAAADTLPVKDEDTTTDATAVPIEPVVVMNEKKNKTNSTDALKSPPEVAQDEESSMKKKVHTKPPPPKKADAALQEEDGEPVDDSLVSSSKPTAAAATNVHAASSSSPSESSPPHDEATTTALFDFPVTGVATTEEKAVNPKEFLEPCRAIATLQIARDLRSDGAVQLSSLLSGLPTDVRKACAASAEHDHGDNDAAGEQFEISEEQARDFSIQVQGDGIVDLDLEEELRNIRTFREIVQRQGEARQKLYTLLTKSNCNFGADEAAVAMYQADKARRVELRKRKRILADAMELEGLDVPEEKSKTTLEQEKLVPLPWYTPPPDDNGNGVAES